MVYIPLFGTLIPGILIILKFLGSILLPIIAGAAAYGVVVWIASVNDPPDKPGEHQGATVVGWLLAAVAAIFVYKLARGEL